MTLEEFLLLRIGDIVQVTWRDEPPFLAQIDTPVVSYAGCVVVDRPDAFVIVSASEVERATDDVVVATLLSLD